MAAFFLVASLLGSVGTTRGDSGDQECKEVLARLLPAQGAAGSGSIHDLLQELESLHPGARERAAARLGDLNDRRAVEPLIDVLRKKPIDAKTRLCVTKYTLRPEDIQVSHEGTTARAAAALALGKLMDDRAVQPLAEVLLGEKRDTKLAGVRAHAATALGLIGNPRAVEPLTTVLLDRFEDPRVRVNCARALARIQRSAHAFEPVGQAFLTANGPWCAQELGEVLTSLEDPRSLDVLLKALESDRLYLRLVAANLVPVDDPRAVDALVLAARSRYPVVRCSAVEALGRNLGDPRALATVEAALSDRRIRDCALAVLEPPGC